MERVGELAPEGVDRAIDDAGGGALPALVELTGIAEAHRLSETGHVRGKLVMLVN